MSVCVFWCVEFEGEVGGLFGLALYQGGCFGMFGLATDCLVESLQIFLFSFFSLLLELLRTVFLARL